MKTNRRTILQRFDFWLLGVFLVLFIQCANRVAPSGGPPDKTPPEVVSTFPAKDSVNVVSIPYIEIRFSENIQRSSFTGNFWIVPTISEKVELKWSGDKKVRLLFEKPEISKSTYVVTLGTGIKDLRGNRMAAPYQFAFSTGAKLDSGKVAGKVFGDEMPEEVFVYAYGPADTAFTDTLLKGPSRYFTQVDKEGHFQLSYLPWGRYRLIALADNNYDKVYSFGQDLIGIPAGDLLLSPRQPTVKELHLQLIKEDTLAPSLRRVDTVSAGWVRAYFSEPVLTDSSSRAEFYDPAGKKNWLSDGMANDAENPRRLHLYFRTSYPADSVIMQIKNVLDPAGNVRNADSAIFRRWPQKADTSRPNLPIVHPENNAGAVYPDDTLRIRFDRPVLQDSLQKAFKLLADSTLEMPGTWRRNDALEFLFIPAKPLPYDSQFTVQVNLSRLRDWWGNVFPDTVLTYRFNTVDKKQLGELSLIVSTPDSLPAQSILTLKKLQSRETLNFAVPTNTQTTVVDIPEGKYQLRAIWDKNKDRKWDSGATVPWQFSEPFIWMSDTVQIRKRWTTEGIRIEFGEAP